MSRCPDCPRASEAEGVGRDDVQGKWCGRRGRSDAPLLLIGMAPGKDELLAGVPFVGGSGRMLRAALAYNDASMDDIEPVNVVNCYPMGKGEIPTYEQLEACRGRFEADVMASKAKVIVPLGDIALKAICDFHGKRQSISYWRGYTIDAHEGRLVPPSAKWIVPAYHPAFIMRSGNRSYPWLRVDIGTAVRAARGVMRKVTPPTSNAPWPTGLPSRIAFDIETRGLDGDIESISLAWVEP